MGIEERLERIERLLADIETRLTQLAAVRSAPQPPYWPAPPLTWAVSPYAVPKRSTVDVLQGAEDVIRMEGI